MVDAYRTALNSPRGITAMPGQDADDKLELEDFIHPDHLQFFIKAAADVQCDILVRKTGRNSIRWVGKSGYTGKRADMKCKTADVDTDTREVAGLVCSPIERPQAFSPDRLGKAWKEWGKSEHLITVPRGNAGFDDNLLPRGCPTPYMLQNNPAHHHYGAVALVEMGLLRPHYVHGDYDLYDIVRSDGNPGPQRVQVRENHLLQTTRNSATPDAIANARIKNLESEYSFRVANIIDVGIAMSGGDILGALMVNHGEQVLLGEDGVTDEPVLVVLAIPEAGQRTRILKNWDDHQAYYQARLTS